MSTNLQTAPKGTLRSWMAREDVREQADHALGGWMKADTFLAQLIISFSDEKVSHCSEESKFAAAHKCVAMALLPSMGHVAIIPRKVKEGGQVVRVDATIMVQWQGMQALMLRHPDVLDIQAHLVHATDVIVYDSVHKLVTDHKFDPFDTKRKFEKLEDVRGGYLVVQYRDGRPDRHHFVDQEVIRKARACAQSQDIWGPWFREQCLKTIYRNAYARRVVPIDPMVAGRVEETINHEDAMLANDPARVQVVSTPEPARVSRAEQLALQSRQTQPPLDVQQPRQPEEAEAAQDRSTTSTKKTKAKEKPEPQGEASQPKKGSKTPPPNTPNHLKDFSSAMHAATTSDAIEGVFQKYTAKLTAPEDYEACCDLRDWKYESTGLERPSYGTTDDAGESDEEGFMRG